MVGSSTPDEGLFPRFDRKFLEGDDTCSQIGSGALGGKGAGLAFIQKRILPRVAGGLPDQVTVAIPGLVVITTDMFDAFMRRNGLLDIVDSHLPDHQIAHAFQRAELPVEMLGDLHSVAQRTHLPLAVRSSSLLEDALAHPFAGVYATKMIPNNQHMADDRFLRLTEAVKFVYASTYFAAARGYRRAIGAAESSEKMALIVQEVVGTRRADRFYPHISGVARSHNHYPAKGSTPENGVICLALGLGKTIVDGGACWSYDPSRPAAPPPFVSPRELLASTQTQFWAVNLGAASYDPVRETEYLICPPLTTADTDGALTYVASTYDPGSDRLSPGTGVTGPRIIDFAPLLALHLLPLNECIRALLETSKEALEQDVEIEFAATLGPPSAPSLKTGFLQVRPMATAASTVTVTKDDLQRHGVRFSSDSCLGNGVLEGLHDIVYVKPERFDPAATPQMAQEIASLNRALLATGTSYVLVGFGRWGTSEPWLGIPVVWGEISGAKTIVEAGLPTAPAEISQGSHFFQNLVAARALYLSIPAGGRLQVDWGWLARQQMIHEAVFLRHVRTASPLSVRVDGRSRRGVIIGD